jgi:hypothetical protein
MTPPTATVRHPSWRELRAGFLSDSEVQQAYRGLEPRFDIERKLIESRQKEGQTSGES